LRRLLLRPRAAGQARPGARVAGRGRVPAAADGRADPGGPAALRRAGRRLRRDRLGRGGPLAARGAAGRVRRRPQGDRFLAGAAGHTTGVNPTDTDGLVTLVSGAAVVVGVLGVLVPMLPGLLLCWAGVAVWAVFGGH